MGIFDFIFGGSSDNDAVYAETYDEAYDSQISDNDAAVLLGEAEWAQDGEPFVDEAVHISVFPDEGAIYVSDSEGDMQIFCIFSYGDKSQADHDLLTSLLGETI